MHGTSSSILKRPFQESRRRNPASSPNGKPTRAQHQRNLLIKLHRRRYGGLRISDDAEGRRFLVCLVALGIPPEEINHLIPHYWPDQELLAIYQEARRFKVTPANLGAAVGLTAAERTRWKLWKLRPCDVPWSEVKRENTARRNAARKDRDKARAEAIRTALPPRQAAVINAVRRLRGGTTVRKIIASIQRAARARATFPQNAARFRMVVNREIDRLDTAGLLEKWKPRAQLQIFLARGFYDVVAEKSVSPRVRQNFPAKNGENDPYDNGLDENYAKNQRVHAVREIATWCIPLHVTAEPCSTTARGNASERSHSITMGTRGMTEVRP